MSNQDLIDQMEADKVRLTSLIAQKNTDIDNSYATITTYEGSIIALNDAIAVYEAEITDLETQIANDDLIIALIPPDA